MVKDAASRSHDSDIRTAPPPDLQRLIEEAKVAAPPVRIRWRDPIAAYGADGISAVTPWFADRRLSAFAVRVVLRAGQSGHGELALRVLRGARTKVPVFVKADVNAAIRELHPPIPPGAGWRGWTRPAGAADRDGASSGPAGPEVES